MDNTRHFYSITAVAGTVWIEPSISIPKPGTHHRLDCLEGSILWTAYSQTTPSGLSIDHYLPRNTDVAAVRHIILVVEECISSRTLHSIHSSRRIFTRKRDPAKCHKKTMIHPSIRQGSTRLVSTCAPMGKSMTHYYFDSSRITRCWTFAGVRLMHHPRRIEEAVFTSQEYGIFLHIPSRTKGILQAISVHRVWKQKSLLSARKSWTVCIQLPLNAQPYFSKIQL